MIGRRRTLRSRIVRTTTVVTAVAMAAMIATVLLVLQGLTSSNIDRRLLDQASAVSTTLVVTEDGSVTAAETPDDTIDETSWIFDASGRLVEGPTSDPQVTTIVESLAASREQTRRAADERVFLATPVQVGGTTRAVVVVEASLEPYESTRDAVLMGLIGVGAFVTAGSAAVAAWAVRRTLAPVESMASRAEDWSEHDLDSRFDATGTDDEFDRLGRTLNILLDRVATALRNEQRLTAELAHELRTPLTAIRGEVELARMGGLAPSADERLARALTSVDRASATITSLLAVARGQQRNDDRSRSADLVAAALEHAPTRDGVHVVPGRVDDVEVPVPLDLAARALSPLVENAVSHARTRVRISVIARDRTLAVTVSDDGDGIAASELGSVFESGTRGPNSSGAGLGLSLARRVARTLGGEVLVESPRGPTTVTLTLPRF